MWLLLLSWSSLSLATNLLGGRVGQQIHPNRHRHHHHDIYIAGFFPTSPGHPGSAVGQGVMPAVKLALHDVNRSPDILPNHHLRMHWNNTACNPGVGLRSFFELVHNGPKKVILFGGACSPVTDQIVKAARHWNLVQVTYADTHPMFTARSFPHFFRVVPSENEFNEPRLALLKQYNWTKVGTLYQNQARYSLAHNDLIRRLRTKYDELDKVFEFEVVLSQSFNDELTTQLKALQKKDIRIILGNFNETWARIVFCEAYKIDFYGSKIQWLIVGDYSPRWWSLEHQGLGCTQSQIEEAVQGTMVMEIQPISSCSSETKKRKQCRRTISNKTAESYEEEYLSSASDVSRRHNTDVYSRYHGYAYDGIWTIARAIQAVETESRKINKSVTDFEYKNEKWEKLFIKALNQTAFEGVTGPVRFKDNSRLGNVQINQIIGEEEVCVGEYSGVTRTLHMERCHAVSWPGNRTKPPKDRTYERIEQTRVNPTVYAILCVAASVGIILGFAFLGINIKYRHQKQIKMSSPNLNNLIIVGCLLCYSGVIILGLDSSLTSEPAFRYICTVKAWVLMAGFTLSFGSMFSKTWRVHSIFTNVQLNKKVMKDSQLFLVVGVLLTIDITIMTTWHLADPFYREIQQLKSYVDYEKDDTEFIVKPQNENCKSDKMTIFVGVIYAYKGLLLLFGAFLAWETRHVQIPALNDSKYIGMSLYNVTIMCVLGVGITAVLDEQKNASFTIISIFIVFCTTTTLCLVFVPKLIELKRNPLGAPVRQSRGIVPMRLKNDATSLTDKLRIANKVNNKYSESLMEKVKLLEDLQIEVGPENVDELLNNANKNGILSSAQVKCANEKLEITSTTSERTTILMDSVENSNSDTNKPDISSLDCTTTTDTNKMIEKNNTLGNVCPAATNFNSICKNPNSTSHSDQQFNLTPGRDAITDQRLFEAQRDLSPLNRDQQRQNELCQDGQNNACSNDERENHRNIISSPLNSPQGFLSEKRSADHHNGSTYFCYSGSTSSLSSEGDCERGGGGLYYMVQESQEAGAGGQDQATQTDDEDNILQTPRLSELARPTKLLTRRDLYCDSRSEEQLNTTNRDSFLTSIYDLQEPPYSEGCDDDEDDDGVLVGQYLSKSGSLGHYADISDSSYVKPRGCKSSNHLNGLNSEQMVPIFHKLYETSRTSKSLALTSYAGIESRCSTPPSANNMVSCPNIAVRCDIVEYL